LRRNRRCEEVTKWIAGEGKGAGRNSDVLNKGGGGPPHHKCLGAGGKNKRGGGRPDAVDGPAALRRVFIVAVSPFRASRRPEKRGFAYGGGHLREGSE